MRLTNNTKLPRQIVSLAEEILNSHHKFEDNRFSVTELLKSDMQILTSRLLDDEIEVDVQDMIELWEETAMHSLMEKHTDLDRFMAEERIEMEIAPNIFISGAFDCLDKEKWELMDYKNTKTPAVSEALAGTDEHWKKQMYLYSVLIGKKYGRKPRKATIIAMCKDHSKVKAMHSKDYQQYPIQMVEFDLTDSEYEERTLKELKEKAIRISAQLQRLRNELPMEEPADDILSFVRWDAMKDIVIPCTYGDQWRAEDWAIIKNTQSRATKVCDTPQDALDYYSQMPDKEQYRIYHRCGEPLNCMAYCQSRNVCPQWLSNDFSGRVEDVTDSIIPF